MNDWAGVAEFLGIWFGMPAVALTIIHGYYRWRDGRCR